MLNEFKPRELGPKPWGTELLIAHTPAYIGKVLQMRAGSRGAYQYHQEKDETFFLFAGDALVKTESGVVDMHPGMSFHVPPGTRHQVIAVTDCTFFECSTPHFDDRVKVE